MYDINCPCCGTTYQGSEAGYCNCCGYEFTETYISELIAAEKKKEKEIQEKIAEEEKQQQLLLEKKELEQKKKEEAKKKAALEKERQEKKEKIKTEFIHAWWIAEEYIGIVVSAIFALIIIIRTIVMSSTTGINAGWIFFILLAIASVFVSGFAYIFFKDSLAIGFTNIIPSGIIGAFALACTISDLWMDMIVDMFREGFLVVLFAGLISIAFFILFMIIALVIIVGISIVLTAFLQTVLDDIKGGLAGLAITVIAAFLYLSMVEQSGVSIVFSG